MAPAAARRRHPVCRVAVPAIGTTTSTEQPPVQIITSVQSLGLCCYSDGGLIAALSPAHGKPNTRVSMGPPPLVPHTFLAGIPLRPHFVSEADLTGVPGCLAVSAASVWASSTAALAWRSAITDRRTEPSVHAPHHRHAVDHVYKKTASWAQKHTSVSIPTTPTVACNDDCAESALPRSPPQPPAKPDRATLQPIWVPRHRFTMASLPVMDSPVWIPCPG